jgi:uncharacterized membrane protein YeaQ/YmgE (transglycosylase-associated protein family)
MPIGFVARKKVEVEPTIPCFTISDKLQIFSCQRFAQHHSYSFVFQVGFRIQTGWCQPSRLIWSHTAHEAMVFKPTRRSRGGIGMDWIVAILVGALIGWLASMVAKTDGQQGALANIVIGIVGASLGRWLFGGVLNIGGASVAGSFSVIGILWGVLGALILIFLLRSVRVLR